jgi:hypothetical protein
MVRVENWKMDFRSHHGHRSSNIFFLAQIEIANLQLRRGIDAKEDHAIKLPTDGMESFHS